MATMHFDADIAINLCLKLGETIITNLIELIRNEFGENVFSPVAVHLHLKS